MPDETPFRIALVVVILLSMAVTVYHRLQAAKCFSTSSRVGKAVIAPLADTASPPETAAKAAKCSSSSKE